MSEPSERWEHPKGYVCLRASESLAIDGKLDKPFWRHAAWTDDFVDIEGEGKPAPRHRTRTKMLWDDRFFYIGASLEEPHVWATLTEHDSVIFQDNDFEVFLDPDGDNHRYGEIEINPLGTVWDLLLIRPYRDGGPAINAWEIPGLLSAVHVEGTLNDPSDVDRGWSVELAIPWKVLAECAGRPAPPKDGERWRVNFSRVQWRHTIVDGRYGKVLGLKEDNWVWSPQWAVDMHRPEHWGYVQFSTQTEDEPPFVPDPAWPLVAWLHQVFHAQRAFRAEHGTWAHALGDLGIEAAPTLELAATDHQFMAWAESEVAGRCSIDHEGCLRRQTLP